MLDGNRLKNKAPFKHNRVASAPVLLLMLFVISTVSAFAQPNPVSTIELGENTLIGEFIDLSISFDNVSADTGYGPFIDLIIPVNGSDGDAGRDTADGIAFSNAIYLGNEVTTYQQTFTDPDPDDEDTGGCVDHPLARDINRQPLQVCGTAGDQLVVLQLPFGSFVADQPVAEISINATLSNLADLGTPLKIHARSGFQFGADPLDNPCCDPGILEISSSDSIAWSNASTTPTILSLNKVYLGPEDETATGPNYPRRYAIEVDVASGQTITDLDITDSLPDNIAFLQVVSTSPDATIVTTPAAGSPENAPNNRLTVSFSSVAGTASANDASVILEFFVPRLDADNSAILNAATGDDVTSANHASALGDWEPIDDRDTAAVNDISVDSSGPEHILNDKSIAIQKSVAIAIDTGAAGVTPGDTLAYTLEFQISDFFAFDNVIVTDVFSDGQSFDNTFIPTLSLTRAGTAGEIDADNFNLMMNSSGGSDTLTFDVSSELLTRGLNSLLPGGCIPDQGTGASDPDCTAFSNGPTTGTIVFRTVVQQDFEVDFPSGDASVDQGDILGNTVDISGDLLSVNDLTANGNSESDNSAAEVNIAFGELEKSIYAINGNTAFSNPTEVRPGDEVTFRLRYTLPTSDFEDLVLTDFLPLPVFGAAQVNQFDNQLNSTIPAAGHAKFGPLETLHNLGVTPNLSQNAGANSITLSYGDFDDSDEQTREIDILFTVTVTDDPFADGLYLTNQLNLTQQSTNGGNNELNAIAGFQLREPVLKISKGAVYSDNANAGFSPAATGPIDFSSAPFSGINSANISSTPVISDISGVDGGDIVRFAIILENTGGSGAFDVRVKDILPDGLTTPAGGMNLSITRGDGNPLSLAGGFSAGDLFADGIELEDPNDQAICQQYHASSGSNVVVIAYDLEVVNAAAVPAAVASNQATITQYAGVDGSGGNANHVASPTSFQDEAAVTFAAPGVSKIISGTSESYTSGNNVTIGERIHYQIELTIPEGTLPNTRLEDTLDNGFTLYSLDGISASNGLNTTHPGGFAGVLADTTVTGSKITFPFDQLDNTNSSNGDAEVIVIDYTVVVTNPAVRGNKLNNKANLIWSQGSVFKNAPDITVKEPTLTLNKTANPTSADAGDIIHYTLTVQHSGSSDSDAFDLSISDAIDDPDLSLIPGTLSTSAGTILQGNDANDTAIQIALDILPLGNTVSVTFDARISNTVVAGTIIDNTAYVNYDSLQGDQAEERVYAPASDSASVNVSIPRLTKAAVESSVDSTGFDQYFSMVQDLTVGEVVTYQIIATLPEGTISRVVIQDSQPASAQGVLELISAQAIFLGQNLITVTNDPPLLNITDERLDDGLDDTIVFDFGQVVNQPDGISDYKDQIIIRVISRVIDIPENHSGHKLENVVLVDFGGTTQPTALEEIEIVEPRLQVDKSGSVTTGDAGDSVVFTIHLSHQSDSSAVAYDVRLEDMIPEGMTYVPNSLIDTGAQPADSLTESNGTITAHWDEFPIDSQAEVQFDVTIDPEVHPGQDILNSASLSWDSLPEDNGIDERVGSTHDDHLFKVSEPGVVKTITATSEAGTGTDINGPEPDLTIGEQVTYQIVVTLPEGLTANAIFSDQLPKESAKLELLDSRVVTVGANLIGAPAAGIAGVASDTNDDAINDHAEWNLSSIINTPDGSVDSDDQIVFEVIAVVVNAGSNEGSDDDDIVNTASLTHSVDVLSGDIRTLSGTALADIVEPKLNIEKRALVDFADAGDEIGFEIDIRHTGTSTASAYNLAIVDELAFPDTAWIDDSSLSSDCPGMIIDSSGDPDITFTIPELTLSQNSCTISYTVRVDDFVQPNTEMLNLVTLDYDSQPAAGPHTRSTQTGDNATVSILAPSLLNITSATSLPDTGTLFHHETDFDLTIGELVDYEITVTFPEGQIPDAVVTDLMLANANSVLEMVGANVVFVGANLTVGSTVSAVGDDLLNDGINDSVVFSLGLVTNIADGVVSDADQLVIKVTGRVVDIPANTDGISLSNFAELTYTGGNPLSDTAAVDVVAPEIAIDKAMSVANDVVTVTLNVTNSGTAPAYDIAVEDVLSAANWDTSRISPLTIPDGFLFSTATDAEAGETTVTVNTDENSSAPVNSVEPGETVSFAFSVPLQDAAALTSISNTALITSASTLPGLDQSERELPEVIDVANLGLPVPMLSKTVSLHIDADDSNTVSPGDTLRYTLTLNNTGDGALTNVVITDIPDDNTRLINGSISGPAGITVNSGNADGDESIEVELGTINSGSSATINYDVVIAATLPAGIETITNRAAVASTERPDILSDDPATQAVEDATLVAVDAVPDLMITASDAGALAVAGATIEYVLTIQNHGNQDATGVVVSESVPVNTVFDADASETVWSCANASSAGTVCTHTIENLPAGTNVQLSFAVTVDNTLPPDFAEILNNASVADDGLNGDDSNDSDNAVSERSPSNTDSDGDCIPDGVEDANGNGTVDPGETDPDIPDSDGDGLTDGQEDTNCNGIIDPDETDPADRDSNDDGLSDGAQFSNNVIYAFEDLKNNPGKSNDFDYNDWVISVNLQESVDDQGNWTRLELLTEALARGAAFKHHAYLDLGIAGPTDIQIEYFDNEDQLLNTDIYSVSGEAIRNIRLFEDTTWEVMPQWPFSGGVLSNTRWQQAGSERIFGRKARIVIDVGNPGLNPRVADDVATQHLHETLNHLLGPWIDVLDTGEQIRQLWRLDSATQDQVTAKIYGSDTPLLGFPLSQAVVFPGDWDWPVERVAIWQAYPDYIDYTYTGNTQHQDWYQNAAAGNVWPTSGVKAMLVAMTRKLSPQAKASSLPAGSFAFDYMFTSPVRSAPAIADIDQDGELEVVAGEFLNKIIIHNADGSVQKIIDPAPGNILESSASVTVVNLDSDNDLEILRGYDDGVLRAFNPDGSNAGMWTVGGTIKSTAAAADLDGNGNVEIIVLGGNGQLYVFNANVSAYPGFPVSIGGIEDISNNFVLLPSPTLTDLDGDDHLDIVVANNTGQIYALNTNGQVLSGWPYDTGELVLSSLAAADLDQNGSTEIIVADDKGGVTVLSKTGSVIWQQQRSLGGPSSPVAGDLDGDGKLEIVVGSLDGKIYAWKHDGTVLTGWPVTTSSAIQGSPIIADVDQNGRNEVFIGSFDTHVYGLSGDGQPLATAAGTEFPVSLGSAIFSSGALADLDGDGHASLVIGAFISSDNRRLFAVEVAGTTDQQVLWQQFRGDAMQQGNSTTADTPPPSDADLSVTIDDSVDPVNTNNQFNYQIDVNNIGPDTAQNVKVQLTLDSALAYDAAIGAGWACTEQNSVVTCTRDSLAVGTAPQITVHVIAPNQAKTISSQVTVHSDLSDLSSGDNTDSENTAIIESSIPEYGADLSIVIDDSADPVDTGAQFSYQLSVFNAGPDVADTVKILLDLSDGIVVNNVVGSGWLCNLSGKPVSCSYSGSLAAGTESVVIVTVTAPEIAGALSSQASVSSVTKDNASGNNMNLEITTVTESSPQGQENMIFSNGFD